MIHRFHVQNYKSIRNISVDLEPVTVLVGRSGTGKSNFLGSFQFLKQILLQRDQHANFIRQKWSTIRHSSSPPVEGLGFELEFSLAGMPGRFSYLLRFLNSKSRGNIRPDHAQQPPDQIEERLTLGQKTLFHHRTGEWVSKPELATSPKPGGILLGKLPSIQEAVIAFTTLTSGVGFYDFSDAVLTGGKYAPSTQGFNDNASNYLNVLQGIAKDLQDLHSKQNLLATLQRVNTTISSVELNDVENPSQVIVGHRFDQAAGIAELMLEQESAGVRRFLAHLLALYQRPPKQTLLFEHPEDGIHPGAMSLLAKEFNDAPEAGRGQVILSTHNPMLLDHFTADQIRVVELKGSETVIGQISSEQREASNEDLLDAGELLTTDPARVETVEREPAES